MNMFCLSGETSYLLHKALPDEVYFEGWPYGSPRGTLMQPDSYAILRFKKLKSLSQIRAMGQHWFRTASTDNADPQRRTMNRLLVGSEDPTADVEALLPAKRRKDAVLAMECLVSASPEYFRPDDPARYGKFDPAKADQWIDRTMTWLHSQYGDRLVSAVFHADEATPHIQAVVVPLGATGNLCANTMFNPRSLQNLQTSYAKALEPLGIKRGIAGSKARHQEVDKHYTAVNASQADIELSVMDRGALATGRTPQKIKDLQAKAGDHENAQKQALQAREAAATISRSNDEAKAALRAVQARLRGIPINDVLPLLGYERDPGDPVEGWKGPAGRLTVGVRRGTPEKFYLHDTGIGGGGAIDLVMQVDNCDFKVAIAWLSNHFGGPEAVATHAAAAEIAAKVALEEHEREPAQVRPFQISQDPRDIAAVSDYLTKDRKITDALVKPLIEKGFIQASRAGRFVNAAFPLTQGRGLGNPTQAIGVSLRGLDPEHPFHGVRGKKGLWTYHTIHSKDSEQDVLVLTESPIDAMSVNHLVSANSELIKPFTVNKYRNVHFVSTIGSTKENIVSVVTANVSSGKTILTAFDNDAAGRQLTETVREAAKSADSGARFGNLTGVLVIFDNLKDFNELLMLFLKEGREKLKKRLDAAREARANNVRERSRSIRRDTMTEIDII